MTTTGQMLQDGTSPTARLRILIVAGVVIILLFSAFIAILKVGADGYFILSPGQAPVVTTSADCRPAGDGSFALRDGRPCVQLVLPPDKVHQPEGSIMMVDVYEGKPNPWDFLLYKVGLLSRFEDHAVFVPNKYIIGNGTQQQLNCQNTQDAMQATSAAPVAALRRLGYTVKEEDVGAQIDTVVQATPAAAAGLRCNDLITALNGHPVHAMGDVGTVVRALAPGANLAITVTRTGENGTSRTVQLTARLSGTPAEQGKPADPKKPFLGVVSETRTKYDFPFPVRVEVGSIGGPSDGLALTLALIDALDGGQLTGRLHVAATGTIDEQGRVGEIGGAAQKAVAVRHAGAQVFLVPKGNFAEARRESGSMKVFAVSSLDQALADLESLGGQVPAPAGA